MNSKKPIFKALAITLFFSLITSLGGCGTSSPEGGESTEDGTTTEQPTSEEDEEENEDTEKKYWKKLSWFNDSDVRLSSNL